MQAGYDALKTRGVQRTVQKEKKGRKKRLFSIVLLGEEARAFTQDTKLGEAKKETAKFCV